MIAAPAPRHCESLVSVLTTPVQEDMAQASYTIGIDYGTNSVRAVVVDTADGRVVGTRVFDYPSGDQGVLLDPKQPHLARQNPADYVEGLRVVGRPAR